MVISTDTGVLEYISYDTIEIFANKIYSIYVI